MNKNTIRVLNSVMVMIFALTLTISCKAASVSYLGYKSGVGMVLLDGQIQTGDLSKVISEYKKAKRESSSVYLMLASPGGSVDEAMKIGDFLEQEQIGAVVPALIGECVSACVLILAGADQKMVNGKVGIHRPFVSDVTIGGAQGAKTLGQYIDLIKRYLDEKGIAPSLAEDMFSVPPEKVKYLTPAEISRYRLDNTRVFA